jgi:hypothetical protein
LLTDWLHGGVDNDLIGEIVRCCGVLSSICERLIKKTLEYRSEANVMVVVERERCITPLSDEIQ